MAKTIVVVGTLDTKGEEVKYLKELIEKRGHRTIVIDAGVLGSAPFPPDVTRDQVAEAAGADLSEIIALADEGKAIGCPMECGGVAILMVDYREGAHRVEWYDALDCKLLIAALNNPSKSVQDSRA